MRWWNISITMFEMWTALLYLNYSFSFQQWNLNQEVIFPNSSIDSKLGFLDIALAGLLSSSQFNKKMDCMKSVQIRSFFWSLFSCIRTKYGDLRSKPPYSVPIQENTNQKKLLIWTLFTQWWKTFRKKMENWVYWI